MNDEEWNMFRRLEERSDLQSSFKRALAETLEEDHDHLEEEFAHCLDAGGVESVYALVEAIDWLRIPVIYPLIAEQFIQARCPRTTLSTKEHIQLGKHQIRFARKLEEASAMAMKIAHASSWYARLAESLTELAATISQLVEDGGVLQAARPGRPVHAGTPLALGLDALFGVSSLPSTKRSNLIAAVVTAFVEPVTGEQIRQRLKDIRRRPR